MKQTRHPKRVIEVLVDGLTVDKLKSSPSSSYSVERSGGVSLVVRGSEGTNSDRVSSSGRIPQEVTAAERTSLGPSLGPTP